jgi:hypothetical protein
MSPGGYNSTTYGLNAAGLGGPGSGVAGFGPRVAAARAARERAIAAARAAGTAMGGVVSVSGSGVRPGTGVKPGTGVRPGAGVPAPTAQWQNINSGFYNPNTPQDWNNNYNPFDDIGYGANWNNMNSPNYGANNPLGGYGGILGRQFGGPVAPGGQYTVGENGPETLQMTPGGGGRIIPRNPIDRMRGGWQSHTGGGWRGPMEGGRMDRVGFGMNPRHMMNFRQRPVAPIRPGNMGFPIG